MPQSPEAATSNALRRRGLSKWHVGLYILLLGCAGPFHAAEARSSRPVDSCQQLRKPFSAIKNYMGQRIAAGVLIGALSGLVAKEATGQKGSVLPWVIGGGITGGVAGYVASRSQDARNKEELRASITQDYQQDVGQFSTLPEALAALGNCRRNQIFELQQSLEAKSIDAEAGKRNLSQIEAWIAKDDEIISKAAGQQARTVNDYAKAVAMSDGVAPAQADQGDWAMRNYGGGASAQDDVISTDVVDPAGVAAPTPAFFSHLIRLGGTVNVRNRPDPSAEVIAKLAGGTPVMAIESDNPGWMAIKLDGLAGHVSAGLLRPLNREELTRQVAAAPRKGVYRLAVRTKRPRQGGPASVASANGQQQSFARVREADRSATAAQLRAARAALEL